MILDLLLKLEQEMEGVGVLAIEAVQKCQSRLGLQTQHVTDWQHQIIPDFVGDLRGILLQLG